MDETISCRGRCGLTWLLAGPTSDVDWYQLIGIELGGCESAVDDICPLSGKTSNGASLISDFDKTTVDDSPLSTTSTARVQQQQSIHPVSGMCSNFVL